MWNKNNDGKYSFDEYLRHGPIPLNKFRYTIDGSLAVDRVIRYENLYKELGEIFEKLGVPYKGELEVKEKSEFRRDRRPYYEALSMEQINQIREIFREEINILGYYTQD